MNNGERTMWVWQRLCKCLKPERQWVRWGVPTSWAVNQFGPRPLRNRATEQEMREKNFICYSPLLPIDCITAWTILPTPSLEYLSSRKQDPGAKKVGDWEDSIWEDFLGEECDYFYRCHCGWLLNWLLPCHQLYTHSTTEVLFNRAHAC